MTSPRQPADDLGPITFSPEEETWFEYQYGDARRRIGFHDYEAIYAVPGLYERVFYGELGMCSAATVVGAFARVLAGESRDPAQERVLDLGAGNGIGGERLHELDVGHLVGLDLEPMAGEAARRDRPGVYDDYVIGDLLSLPDETFEWLRAQRFTAVLALAAIGVGHIPPAALERALGLLEPGQLFAFAVTPALLPGSNDPAGCATGYPELLARLLGDGRELTREAFVHRRQADGTPHDALALVGRAARSKP